MKKATAACHAVQDAGEIPGCREEFLSIKDDTCHFERLPLGALCVLIFLLLLRSPGGLEMDNPWTLSFACPFLSPLLGLFCFQMTLVMFPVDGGAAALWKGYRRWPGVSVGALLNLDYPQIFAASRIVSCEVRMLSLSKPCETLVKLL